MNRILSIAAMAGTTLALTMSADADQQYTININRPFTVGQRMHILGEGSQEQTMTSVSGDNQRELAANRFTISLDAEAEVLQVDASGHPTQMVFTIDQCTLSTDGQTSSLAPPGSVIVANRRQSTTEFTHDGKSFSPMATQALNLVAALHPEAAQNEQIVGSTQPRSIGETWPINAGAAATSFQQEVGQSIDASQVSGSATLVDLRDHDGQSCMLLRSKVTADNFMPGHADLPDHFQLKHSSLTARYQGLMPMDSNLPSLSESVRMTMEAVLTDGQAGQPTEIHMKTRRVAQLRTTPMMTGQGTASVTSDQRMND